MTVCLAAVLVSVSVGCTNYEAIARAHLTAEGLVDLVLEPREAEGSFSYRGNRHDDACVGQLAVFKERGNSQIHDRVSCKPNPALCQPSRPSTCYRLGLLHAAGDSDPMDPTAVDQPQSSMYFAKGCAGGHARSCNITGLRYAEGKGIAPNLEQAAASFERSCQLGHGRGCYNWALSFHNGAGVSADLARAGQLYDQACKQEVAKGCYNLGVLYRDGSGHPRDLPRAAQLFGQGCRAGYLQACVNLGVMATSGQGVPRDEARAIALFRRACAGGLQTGCDGVRRLGIP